MPRARFVPLLDELTRQRPDLDRTAAEEAVAAGLVQVDGRIVHNAASKVRRGCAVTVSARRELRGVEKLGHVLDRFAVRVAGRVVVDVGAAAGGFTRALLERGAARVYAVDVGHGQLVGSLRQDARVVNLESTNVAALDRSVVPEPVGGVSIDVSYLSLAEAVRCVGRLDLAPGAWLAGLVKPMFELGRSELPTETADFALAVDRARAAIGEAGWQVQAAVESAVRGANGAVEFFVLATRPG